MKTELLSLDDLVTMFLYNDGNLSKNQMLSHPRI